MVGSHAYIKNVACEILSAYPSIFLLSPSSEAAHAKTLALLCAKRVLQVQARRVGGHSLLLHGRSNAWGGKDGRQKEPAG
jgi:hypothetical protein